MQPAIAEEIRALAAGPLDWDFIFSAASANSITPLVARQLRAVLKDDAAEAAPAELARLEAAARANMVRSLLLSAELIKILDAFRSQEILAIPYKGPVLAAQAYGDATLREFEDLDIILRHRDIPKAHELMLGLGFHAKFPQLFSSAAGTRRIPGEYNYREETGRVVVELHTEATLRHFPVAPDPGEFAARAMPVRLCGLEVKTLSPEDALVALSIHGSKDFWERILWTADISELIQAEKTLDWDAVWQCAESFRAQRMVCLGLALAHGALDAPLPAEISARVSRDAVAASAASEIVRRHLKRESLLLSSAWRFGFRRRMVPGALAGWRYALRLAMVPAEEDWEIMRLPRPLAPVYAVLRPLRLLRKYKCMNRGSQGNGGGKSKAPT
ncbi:MAG: nucleotidyltransferase family protein [Candidatus Acidiferrales bacterium]